jgi:hypothetical protein
VAAHYDFYQDLRNRFRYKKQVDQFVNATFRGHVVLGMHIRAGNGEQGDFANKKRGIENIDQWIQQASLRIKEFVKQEQWNEPPLLYIATDTPSLIRTFRHELEGVMAVVEFPQERRGEGDGIFFGEQGKTPKMTDHQCIRQWENAVADMILLSHADVLIAGRMSSFVQTMPMSLVFGRSPEESKVSTPKCEVNLDASDMIVPKRTWNGAARFAVLKFNRVTWASPSRFPTSSTCRSLNYKTGLISHHDPTLIYHTTGKRKHTKRRPTQWPNYS